MRFPGAEHAPRLVRHPQSGPQDLSPVASHLSADPLSFLGPLQELMADPAVTEVLVVDEDRVFVERHGYLHHANVVFPSRQAIVDIAQRIIAPLGRELTMAQPFVDGRIPVLNVRVTATVPPFSRTPTLCLRKHNLMSPEPDAFVAAGSASGEMMTLMGQVVRERRNFLICGPTGSGKTTTARLLARFIPRDERIITLEDTFELSLSAVHPHVVELETRSPNREGRYGIDTAEALRHVLHMRPDRIILGEVRAGEALQLLTAMGTGHRGSYCTIHAESVDDVFDRLVFAMMQSGTRLPAHALRLHALRTIHFLLYTERCPDGQRRWTRLSRVDPGPEPRIEDIFRWDAARAQFVCASAPCLAGAVS